VRATASAFCYHQGAIWGGLTAPVLVYFANAYDVSLAIPMLIGTVGGLISFIAAVSLGPETGGKVLAAELVVT
jgi:MFS transporter, SHS family, lactate transporter